MAENTKRAMVELCLTWNYVTQQPVWKGYDKKHL